VKREAVGLRRQLATDEPAAHTPNLAQSLNNLGASLRDVGDHRGDLDARTEGAAWWQRLASTAPGEFDDMYQSALAQLAMRFAEAGHEPGAAIVAVERAARELPTIEQPESVHSANVDGRN
jgi:hypothetical protein